MASSQTISDVICNNFATCDCNEMLHTEFPLMGTKESTHKSTHNSTQVTIIPISQYDSKYSQKYSQ